MDQLNQNTSCAPDDIKHKGKIVSIDEQNIVVSILTKSACASCQVKGACNMNEIQEEEITVPRSDSREFKNGDEVEVAMKKSLGTKAVILGYFLPFLILLITLIIALEIIGNEGVAGLMSLGILIPYYLILYFNRNQLKRTFVFYIV